jgi:hypothetical protein
MGSQKSPNSYSCVDPVDTLLGETFSHFLRQNSQLSRENSDPVANRLWTTCLVRVSIERLLLFGEVELMETFRNPRTFQEYF